MFRKILISVLVFFLSIVGGVFIAQKQVEAPTLSEWSSKLVSDVVQNEIFTDPAIPKEEILKKINEKRAEFKLGELKVDEKLDKAAKARLAVIITFDDYIGTSSALTREKSLALVDYKETIVGDVLTEIKNNKEDYIAELMSDEIEKETILHPKFTDIGIADYKSNGRNYYYMIFGNKASKVVAATPKAQTKATWGGPEVWEAVNKRRVEFGVGQLNRKDELCTIASVRLNQLLELGKLDGHAGFQPLLDRADLKWIGEKYNVSEYLAQGFSTPQETVKGWENTLGHRSLLTGGEFVWGCIYSQNTFSVAISAY